jgi:hypothetical protein
MCGRPQQSEPGDPCPGHLGGRPAGTGWQHSLETICGHLRQEYRAVRVSAFNLRIPEPARWIRTEIERCKR